MPKLNATARLEAMAVTYLPIEKLKPSRCNPRTHSAKQIEQIAKSIKAFGFVNPVLIDQGLSVIAGHGRIEAAHKLGMKTVPTLRIDHMTEAQKRAYIIADNKLALNAGWDEELLRLEFQYFSDLDAGFDLTLTGFEMPEIDFRLYGESLKKTQEIPEMVEIIVPEQSVSRLGDLWVIGPHRLYCGDATKKDSFKALLGNNKASMVFTDPPFNVPIQGHVSSNEQHGEFPMASGEMSEGEFIHFLETVFQNLSHASCKGSLHYICMDWRHIHEIIQAGKRGYTELKNLCVWNKTNGGMGSFYRSKHELIFVFKSGRASHVNNVQLGQHGRNRTNVWDYAGVNTFKENRKNELAMHPTVKPTALVADAILDCSNPKDIILDCFGGSGTTMIATQKTGRIGYLMELDPKYVDVIIMRYQKDFKTEAILQETGQTFSRVKKARKVEAEEVKNEQERQDWLQKPTQKIPLSKRTVWQSKGSAQN